MSRQGKTRLLPVTNYVRKQFCNLKCKSLWQETLIGIASYNYKGGMARCSKCTKLLSTRWNSKHGLCRACLMQSEILHPRWKGIQVGYYPLHAWVYKHLGHKQECDFCGTNAKRMYHWANKSGEYKRILEDWIRLCVPCHKRYDLSR